jgi:hypothetical protein
MSWQGFKIQNFVWITKKSLHNDYNIPSNTLPNPSYSKQELPSWFNVPYNTHQIGKGLFFPLFNHPTMMALKHYIFITSKANPLG